MAFTALSNLISTQQFADGVYQESLYNNALITSGVIRQDPKLGLVQLGGNSVQVFGYQPMDATEDNLTGSLAPNVNNLVQVAQTAVVMRRRVQYGADYVSGLAAYGQKPMEAIQQGYGKLIAQNVERDTYSLLSGLFGTYNDSTAALKDLSLNVSAVTTATPTSANLIKPSAIISADSLGLKTLSTRKILLVHPHVLADMRQDKAAFANGIGDANRFRPDGTLVNYYSDCEVIASAQLPVLRTATHYTRYASYMFEVGAIAIEAQAPVSLKYFDDVPNSAELISCTRANVIHVLGTNWSGAIASPTAGALATKTNYSLVWNVPNIKVTRIITNATASIVEA